MLIFLLAFSIIHHAQSQNCTYNYTITQYYTPLMSTLQIPTDVDSINLCVKAELDPKYDLIVNMASIPTECLIHYEECFQMDHSQYITNNTIVFVIPVRKGCTGTKLVENKTEYEFGLILKQAYFGKVDRNNLDKVVPISIILLVVVAFISIPIITKSNLMQQGLDKLQ